MDSQNREEFAKWGIDRYTAIVISRLELNMVQYTNIASISDLEQEDIDSKKEKTGDPLEILCESLYTFMLNGGCTILTKLANLVDDMFTKLDENEPMFFHEYLLHTIIKYVETPEYTLLTHPKKMCYLILQMGNKFPEHVFAALYHNHNNLQTYNFEVTKRLIDLITINPRISLSGLYDVHFDHFDRIENSHFVCCSD